jgi:hypothetical protein
MDFRTPDLEEATQFINERRLLRLKMVIVW